MLLQFIVQYALDVYQLAVLAICLLNLFNIFHHNQSNIVQGQIHLTLCSTCLLNNKNYNICFLTISFYRLCST